MNTNIYLQTAFAFMCCDGEITPEEIQLIREMHENRAFPVVDIEAELKTLASALNKEGKDFLRSYLQDVELANLSKEDALRLLKIAVKTIYVDNDVEYNEIKFFRAVRLHLHAIDDDYILENIPEIEDFWLASDIHSDTDSLEKDYFDSVELPQFNISEVKLKE